MDGLRCKADCNLATFIPEHWTQQAVDLFSKKTSVNQGLGQNTDQIFQTKGIAKN